MGVALETVTVQPQHNSTPRQVRISAKIRAAIEAMVDGCLSRQDAARHAGITDHALYCALRQSHVVAYRNDRMRVIRTGESARSIKRIADLAHSASSEAVKFDANKFILATDPDDPVSPVTKSESTINHKGLGPGLTIIMSQPEQARVISNQPHQLEYVSREKHLSPPVPHPSFGTPQIEVENPRASEAQEADRVGGKRRRRR